MIDFLKYTKIYLIVSFIVIFIGVVAFVKNGFIFSLDLVGGTLVEYKINSNNRQERNNEVNKVLEQFPGLVEQTKQGFIVKEKNTNKNKLLVLEKNSKLEKLREESVGASVSSDNIRRMLTASVFAVLGIFLYTLYSFKRLAFAVGATLALFHDILVLLGVWAVLGMLFAVEFDVLFVTALLTTMSFSVHDTIVIMDTVKESEGQLGLYDAINQALTRTMVRSLNNSLTIVIMLMSLVVLGGESVRWFAVALLVGTITGTYSSPFVAAPLSYFFGSQKRVK